MDHRRRRFLHVLGAATAGLAAGCSAAGDSSDASSTGTHHHASSTSAGSGGGSGAGGADTTSTASGAGGSTSATSTGSGCTNPPGVAVGTPDAYATDGLHKVSGTKVLIGRDANGLYALSSLCTHQYCNMNSYGSVKSNGIRCTCHGSIFGDDGSVLQGPAYKPLPAYALALGCDGNLYVDTSTKVPASQRLAV